MADDPTLPSPGDVLAGKYRIERLIGRGGMGAVFAAQHTLLNQRVAVKLLLGELARSPEAMTRFMNEARAAAQIQGEHVARVLDIGQLPTGMPFMVLEYLEGADLADVLKSRGVLTVPEVADYALQALEALGQAHAAGIVHRDLKPANLFLARRHDGSSVVKVLDFGISKNLSPLAGTPQGMTQTRALLGSPEYMSPEQLRTPRGVDARTDIWSMGVILYELLSARMPFAGESLGELFIQIMESPPTPLRSHRPDVPAALEAVVMRCLARDRDARYANVGELAETLKVFASDQMRALLVARASVSGAISKPMVAETLPMPMTAYGVTPNPSVPNTAAPWAHTGPGAGAVPAGNAKRSKAVAILGASLLSLVVLGIFGFAAVKKMGAESEAAPAGLAIGAANASPAEGAKEPATAATGVAAARDAAPAKLEPAKLAPAIVPVNAAPATQAAPVSPVNPSPAAPAAPPPTANAKPATPAPARTGGVGSLFAPAPAPESAATGVYVAPLPTATAVPAAAPSKNCTPNYYFDKDGRKHFKPECF
jgi:hypothetical protein